MAIHLINRLPSSVLKFKTPNYHLYQQHPHYLNMHTFRRVYFVHLSSHERNKMFAQFLRCAFMGYIIFHKSYACYDPCS